VTTLLPHDKRGDFSSIWAIRYQALPATTGMTNGDAIWIKIAIEIISMSPAGEEPSQGK